jgi:hypothetical protein
VRSPHPRIVRDEEALRVRYPLKVATAAGEARFRRSRWCHLNEGEDMPAVRHREGAGWLYDGETRAALLTFEEYDLECGTRWDEFWLWADGYAEQSGDAVLAMQEYWGGVFPKPPDYGPIVLLSGGWIAPPYRSRLPYRDVFDAVLRKLSPKHSVAVLLAHPAESDEDPADAHEAGEVAELGGFDWRQRALMRFYQRELGFSPLPAREARFGFMWRPRANIAEYLAPDDD